MFDSFLTFSYNATILSSSARRAVGLLRFKLKHLKQCGWSTYTKLFSPYICPILDYCSGVWGLKPYDEVERVQRNALRYFLGVHKFAANDFVLGESGWVSCCGRHQLAALRLWNRLISLSPDRLTAQIFAWDLSFSDTPGSWSNGVNQTLNDISQPHVFENLEICDLEQAYDSLLNYENNKWNASRYNNPKLRYYNMYKYSLETENYLFFNIPRYHRSLFAQFRAGILPLNIETGRYRNVSLPDRLCTLCDDSEVEDEIHFLCVCKFYSEYRSDMYNAVTRYYADFNHLDQFDKCVYLIANEQKCVISFIVKALLKRKRVMYIS